MTPEIEHRQNFEVPRGGKQGIEAFKKTCDLLGVTCLCSSLVSEPAVTRLLLSTGIMGCRVDGRRGDSRALLQLVCVGEDGSFKCCMFVRSPAAWEHTDHMHGNVGRQAVLTAGERPFNFAHLVWLGSSGLTAPGDSKYSTHIKHKVYTNENTWCYTSSHFLHWNVFLHMGFDYSQTCVHFLLHL